MFTLLVNAKKFDKQVWQHETEFNKEKYNKCLKVTIDNLQLIYNTYNVDGVDCGDVYLLGDIINILSTIRIKLEKKQLVKYKRKK